MTGLLTAETQERALGHPAHRSPPAPIRQPSKEDLELAHQLVQHSEGRRDAGGGSCRVEYNGVAGVAGMAPHGNGRDGGHVEESTSRNSYVRQSSSSEETQRDRQLSGQINSSPPMGQVCR